MVSGDSWRTSEVQYIVQYVYSTNTRVQLTCRCLRHQRTPQLLVQMAPVDIYTRWLIAYFSTVGLPIAFKVKVTAEKHMESACKYGKLVQFLSRLVGLLCCYLLRYIMFKTRSSDPTTRPALLLSINKIFAPAVTSLASTLSTRHNHPQHLVRFPERECASF